jgi:hypothetical protein
VTEPTGLTPSAVSNHVHRCQSPASGLLDTYACNFMYLYGKVKCPCALTVHHAMKAHWEVEV